MHKKKKKNENEKEADCTNNNRLSKEDNHIEFKKVKAVHNGITCDICEIFPIVGVRYKCSVRTNYDICEQCEQNSALIEL